MNISLPPRQVVDFFPFAHHLAFALLLDHRITDSPGFQDPREQACDILASPSPSSAARCPSFSTLHSHLIRRRRSIYLPSPSADVSASAGLPPFPLALARSTLPCQVQESNDYRPSSFDSKPASCVSCTTSLVVARFQHRQLVLRASASAAPASQRVRTEPSAAEQLIRAGYLREGFRAQAIRAPAVGL